MALVTVKKVEFEVVCEGCGVPLFLIEEDPPQGAPFRRRYQHEQEGETPCLTAFEIDITLDVTYEVV